MLPAVSGHKLSLRTNTNYQTIYRATYISGKNFRQNPSCFWDFSASHTSDSLWTSHIKSAIQQGRKWTLNFYIALFSFFDIPYTLTIAPHWTRTDGSPCCSAIHMQGERDTQGERVTRISSNDSQNNLHFIHFIRIRTRVVYVQTRFTLLIFHGSIIIFKLL